MYECKEFIRDRYENLERNTCRDVKAKGERKGWEGGGEGSIKREGEEEKMNKNRYEGSIISFHTIRFFSWTCVLNRLAMASATLLVHSLRTKQMMTA